MSAFEIVLASLAPAVLQIVDSISRSYGQIVVAKTKLDNHDAQVVVPSAVGRAADGAQVDWAQVFGSLTGPKVLDLVDDDLA